MIGGGEGGQHIEQRLVGNCLTCGKILFANSADEAINFRNAKKIKGARSTHKQMKTHKRGGGVNDAYESHDKWILTCPYCGTIWGAAAPKTMDLTELIADCHTDQQPRYHI